MRVGIRPEMNKASPINVCRVNVFESNIKVAPANISMIESKMVRYFIVM